MGDMTREEWERMMFANPIGTSRMDDQSMTNQTPGFDPLAGIWNGRHMTQSQIAELPVDPFSGQMSDKAKMMAEMLMGATSSPVDVAGRIAKHASKLGYVVSKDASKQSSSQYLGLAHDVLPDTQLKVRVSDHALPPSYGPPGDFDVIAGKGGLRESGTGWAETVKSLAERVGLPVPGAAKALLTKEAKREATARAVELAHIQAREAAAKSWHLTTPKTAAEAQLQMLAKEFPDYVTKIAPNTPDAGRYRREVAALYEKANPGKIEWIKSIDPR